MIKKEHIKHAIDQIEKRSPEIGYSLDEMLGMGVIDSPSEPDGPADTENFHFLFDGEKVLVNRVLFFNEGTVPIEQGLLIKYGELDRKQELQDRGGITTFREAYGEIHRAGLRLVVMLQSPLFPLLDGTPHNLDEAGLRITIDLGQRLGVWRDHDQAINAMTRAAPTRAGDYSEAELTPHLAMSYAPEPDLFIRTGGEQRISNFLIWQLAYAELYFTDRLWPDFDSAALEAAFTWYLQRERRFGRTSEQLARSPASADAPEEPAVAVPATISPRRARGPA